MLGTLAAVSVTDVMNYPGGAITIVTTGLTDASMN